MPTSPPSSPPPSWLMLLALLMLALNLFGLAFTLVYLGY